MSDLIVRIWSQVEAMEATREGGSVDPNLCCDWERWGPKCRPVIHEHGLVVCHVDAKAGGGSLFGHSESGANDPSRYKKTIICAMLRGVVQCRG